MENNVGIIRHKIYELRKILQNMIECKDDLLDPDIIKVSSLLDEILNEYDEILKR
ncbi:MAG: Spo0E family sporulation regulatory protein-aspartic acid phosphatase [Ruminiclostridium sp.]